MGVLGVRAERLHAEQGNRHVTDGPMLAALQESLPFTLTQPQLRCVDDILEDPEARSKTSVKDLSLGYAITSDKERDARGENRVVTHEHKLSLEDARQAIEAARKRIKDGGDKVIEV